MERVYWRGIFAGWGWWKRWVAIGECVEARAVFDSVGILPAA